MKLSPWTRIIGIDPGPKESALVIVDGNRRIVDHLHGANGTVRLRLDNELADATQDWWVAIEDIRAYGGTVRPDALETAVQVGRFEEIAEAHIGIFHVHREARPTVARVLTGSNKNTKTQVKYRVQETFGKPKIQITDAEQSHLPKSKRRKTKPGQTAGLNKHEWDALAMCEWLIVTKGAV